MMTIEEKVSQAILEAPIAELELEGRTYKIAPPSISTLILVSEIVSTFPVVDAKENVLTSVLKNAKDFRRIGDLVAVLILGRNGLTEEREIEERVPVLHGLFHKTVKRTITVDVKTELGRLILDNVRPSVLNDLVIKRLNDLEIGDFFAITTSLTEANLLKPTAEVV